MFMCFDNNMEGFHAREGGIYAVLRDDGELHWGYEDSPNRGYVPLKMTTTVARSPNFSISLTFSV